MAFLFMILAVIFMCFGLYLVLNAGSKKVLITGFSIIALSVCSLISAHSCGIPIPSFSMKNGNVEIGINMAVIQFDPRPPHFVSLETCKIYEREKKLHELFDDVARNFGEDSTEFKEVRDAYNKARSDVQAIEQEKVLAKLSKIMKTEVASK